MTNKYSGLSDADINELIAVNYDRVKSTVMLHAGWFDYCGNDALAFKLMIDNEISLEKIRTTGSWKASSQIVIHNLGYPMIVFTHQKNPCRAIAECFLLMKDAENE